MPQQSAVKTAEIWGPVANYLSDATGYNVRLASAPTIPEFEQRLFDQAYDIAFMNPFHLTVFADDPGYRAIAHRAGQGINGIIVVKADSSITDISQLNGEQIAFPAPAAFAATLINGAELNSAGVAFTPVYTQSHDSVYRTVASGRLIAGGGIGRTLLATDEAVKSKLRVLHTTQRYTPHAIAVSPRVDEEIAQNLQSALQALTDPNVLGPLRVSGFVEADNSQWDDVRALELQPLERLD